jgi:hypothetical protein
VATILPPPNFRECDSCVRDLSYGHFGLQRVSSDLYHKTCKDCRRYHRKVSYYRAAERNGFPNPDGKAKALAYVFPLNEQNRKVLSLAILDSQTSSLSARFIKTGQSATLTTDFSSGDPSFSLHVNGELISTWLCGKISLEQFIEVSVVALRELRIRLD